jgi:hypothetical protein
MTSNEILDLYEMNIGTAKRKDIQLAMRLADEGGTIQAVDTIKLFGLADPTKHTAMTLYTALLMLGCTDIS